MDKNHDRVNRPWGGYELFETGPGYLVKLMSVDPGHRMSLQRHLKRAERVVVVQGHALILIGEDTQEFTVGDTVEIAVGMVHRISNPGDTPLAIVEVQFGETLSEDDIERIEDDYGRV